VGDKERGPIAPDDLGDAQGRIAVRITYVSDEAGGAKPARAMVINRGALHVYDSSGDQIAHGDLTISSGRATGSIVAAAAQRDLRVAVVLYDGETVRYVGEDPDVDVIAGAETTAEISAYFMGTSVSAPASILPDEQFSVSWQGPGPSPRATRSRGPSARTTPVLRRCTRVQPRRPAHLASDQHRGNERVRGWSVIRPWCRHRTRSCRGMSTWVARSLW